MTSAGVAAGAGGPAAGEPPAVVRRPMDRAALERLAGAGTLAALVDACDAPAVPARVLDRFPEGGACLYQGHDALAFRDRAPYLVRVDAELLAWLLAPSAEGGLGDTPWGLFVVSDAPFAALVRHWRGWLTVSPPPAPAGASDGAPPDAAAPMAFRFYDPRLTPVFLGACTAAEVAGFYGPARALVVPAWDGDGAEDGAAGWALTPGLAAYAAQTAGAPRRGVGERFRMRDAHTAAFRRRNFGGVLIAGVEREAALLGQRAARDPADPVAGDVLVTAVDAEGRPAARPTRLGFDARGFVGTVTSPLGRRWTIESGPEGQPRRLTAPSGSRLTYRYGADGQVAGVTRGVPGAEQGLCSVERDAAGRAVRTRYADGTQATAAYEETAGAAVRDPVGARPTVVTDRLGRTTRYAWDADGDLTAVTDALGRTTRLAYGPWRQRPTAITHPDGRRERYAYDGAGDVTAITGGDGVVLRVGVDAAGRPRTLASDGGAGVAGVAVAFERDAAGRITEARTEARAEARAGGVPTMAQFGYDAAGRLVRETATVGAVGLAVAGAAAGEEPPAAGPLVAGAAPLRTVVECAYDPQGALVGVTGPTGERVAYAYDADGRPIAVTDWDGRRYEVSYAPADGGWTLRTPGGVTLAVARDPDGRPVRQLVRAPNGATVVDVTLRHDDEDRVAEVRDSRLGRWAYAYDAEGQLVACDGPTAAEWARYAYDAAGNRVAVEAAPGAPPAACAVDAGDRLLRQGAVRLAYDAAGRAVGRSDDFGLGREGAWRYAYDARGQLVRAWGRAADGAARALAFAYDAFGRRVWKVAVERAPGGRVAARRTRFVWAGEHLVREVAEAAGWDAPAPGGVAPALGPDGLPGEALAAALLGGAAPPGAGWRLDEARDYAYWPGTATPLLLRVARPGAGAPATYLYHTDPLGTPVRLTDAAGRVVWEAAYAAFGEARVTAAEVAQPWRRPGQYADDETGLCYNRLRYYDPRLGRYLTPDPAGLLGGLHPYRYARNAPTCDADPLGLWPSWGTIAAGVVAAVVGVAVAVVLAPVAGPVLAVLAAGAIAGAVFGGLNEGLNNGFDCVECVAMAAAKGAVVGAVGAIPFAAAAAVGAVGVGALALAGAASGGLSYTADWAINGADPGRWSWSGFLGSVALGTGLGALGGKIGGSGGSPPLAMRVSPQMAVAGGPAVATEVVVIPGVSAGTAAGVGTGVQAATGSTVMMMSGSGGGGGSGGDDGRDGSDDGGDTGSGQRGVTDEEYEWLRSRTPSTALRRSVNRGVTLPMDDPALPGQQITKPLQADHVVSMDRITRMDGFGQLTRENQLRVLNDPDNFVGLSEAANKSKGARSFADWTEHKGLGVSVDPEFRRRMVQLEQETVPKLESRIQELLREQQRGGGQ